jgi:hypothetical protein
MTTEQLFSAANLFALLGWIPLLLAPLRRGAAIATARWVGAILAGLYTVLFVGGMLAGGTGAGELEMTAAGLAAAFSRPEVLLVGWVHYLAFDLWVGAWITQNAGERGVSHVWVVPCLVLCFLAGPIGLLLYLLLSPGAKGRPITRA